VSVSLTACPARTTAACTRTTFQMKRLYVSTSADCPAGMLHRMVRMRRIPLVITGALLLAACGRDRPRAPVAARAPAAVPSCDVAAIRTAIDRFGSRLKQVSLLAPDRVRAREIHTAYGPLVTPELVARWLADPAHAPGRTTSSPWPEHIEVDSVTTGGGGGCRVAGDVVYVTSTELAAGGGVAARAPVTLLLRAQDGDWRIAEYHEQEASGSAATARAAGDEAAAAAANTADAADHHSPAGDEAAAADVVRGYYAAIAAHRYRAAYELWAERGQASGQGFPAFAQGFAGTASVTAAVGPPGRMEGAAGSRYVEVPVTIRAVTTTGERQRFRGSYTLRRSVVEGASAAQRRWHIYSARIVPYR